MATAAKCSSIKIDSADVDGPISARIIRDRELVEKVYGDTDLPMYYLGTNRIGISVTFTDVAKGKSIKKGDIVTIVAVISGTSEPGSGPQAPAAAITATATSAVVTESVAIESTTDGAPIEFQVTAMCPKGATLTVS